MIPFNKADFIQQSIDSKLIHFDELALRLYRHQLEHCVVLQQYTRLINAPQPANHITDVRFLPVVFFKHHEVKSGTYDSTRIFTSSTTSGGVPSRHHVADPAIYKQSYLEGFNLFYGSPEQYVFLCLLPGYLERSGSSLIDMAQGLIMASKQPESGFYLYDFEKLNNTINEVKAKGKRVFLLGVTFALLDFATAYPQQLDGHIVMETGGMKGRREEQTRAEIHAYLQQQLGLQAIHSEYGMTELLSQAYAKKGGIFECPPWMKVFITDASDPLSLLPEGKTGIINVIDLANADSCAFIQTQDLGRMVKPGHFEVAGRLDFSETRGCNLMYT